LFRFAGFAAVGQPKNMTKMVDAYCINARDSPPKPLSSGVCRGKDTLITVAVKKKHAGTPVLK
jgi:hypothetical protein